MPDRLDNLRDFYGLLDRLRAKQGHSQTLGQAVSHLPPRGVYFFMESGEVRSDSGSGPRVVRVGTHALIDGAHSTLHGRLNQHRGQIGNGGGNHRGSIFRKIVGVSLSARDHLEFPTWGQGNAAEAAVRAEEQPLEQLVSTVIRAMPFLFVAVDDEPGAASERGIVERNAIALLSNFHKPPSDPPSSGWLGHRCDREKVRLSGLWNSNHVEEPFDPNSLDVLARCVEATETHH